MNIIFNLSILILISSISLINSERVSFEGYNVWSVTPKSRKELENLRKWENIEGIDIWELGMIGKNGRIMVSPLSEGPFLDFLQSAQIDHKLLIENVEKNFEEERRQQELSKKRLADLPKIEGRYTVDFNHFWTTTEINDYINYLINFYRDICQVDVVGHSVQGQLIRSVKISMHGQVDGSRPIIFIDAGIHAREWITYMVAVKILHELVEHHDHHLDILSNVDWIITPIVNPDGYEYTYTTYRMWRKNRRINQNPNCPGVDCNRNYDIMWQPVTNQCSETYSGVGPFSEPESAAVKSTIDEYGSAIKVYLSLHSYGEYLLYPWAYANIDVDNVEQHIEAGTKFYDAVHSYNGTTYSIGNWVDLLYIAYGCSADYMSQRGVPLTYTIELSGGAVNGFDLPASEIPRVTNELWLGIRAFGLHTDEYDWD